MKILIIHNRYRQAGGEDQAVKLDMELLRKHGHEVDLLEFHNDELHKFSAPKYIYNPGSRQLVRDRILHFRPDIVHIHNLFFEASPSVLSAARSTGIPVVMTLHNYRLVCCNALLLRDGHPCTICVNKRLPLAGIRYACYRNSRPESALVTAITSSHKLKGTWKKQVDRYIVLTEFAKDLMADSSLHVPKDRFAVVPNFVPDRGWKAEGREGFYLFAGRLSPEKGAAIALEAARLDPSMQLKLAGDGPEREALQARYGALPNVQFLGTLSNDDLSDWMKRCRALIFPSIWYEGLPYILLEAFSTGTPVIASNLGAMKSMVTEGKNGWLFEPGSASALLQALQQMNQNDHHITACRGARRTFEEMYASEQHYLKLTGVYRSVITAK